jgi:hypothetical protein
MDRLNILYCAVGLVNRGPAAQGGKAAQNNDKETDSRQLHNCRMRLQMLVALAERQ